MLDTKQSWDALVTRHAPSREVAGQILANPFYVNLTQRFARSHEYIAMERLYELYAEGRYDLIVVDTPPALGALDFLDAPERMAEFFSSRLLRWLTAPARSRLVGLASRPFTQLADRILGSQLLEELAVFFNLFQSMYPGFVARAHAVSALLREPQTTFMVVTSPEPVPVREARAFVGALAERRLHLGVVVANKVLPPAFSARGALRGAETLQRSAGALANRLVEVLPEHFPDRERLERVIGEVGSGFSNFAQVATREQQLIDELAGEAEQVVRVPHLMHDVTDLGGLLEIADHLFE
jgi:anion-transporting  ArsA/GET3 family ATPase